MALSFVLTLIITGCDGQPASVAENVSEFYLVSGGATEYVIVRGADCSASEVTASTELQSYIKQISGVEIPIVTDDTASQSKEIIVGKTNREGESSFTVDRDELGDEGFIIKTVGYKLIIAGGELRGTLYGVYSFLEEYLGCRYYTAALEKVPASESVTVAAIEENKQIPVLEYRDSAWASAFDAAFSVKRKINSTVSRSFGEEYGGGVGYAGSFVHTLKSLAEMPDDSSNTQPCLTDPEVFNTVLKNVKAWLDANPAAKIISVSQNDNGNPCMCENCAAAYAEDGNYTGTLIRFVNAIAEAIKDDYPDVYVDTLAYWYTREAPLNVVPDDNVIVRLCSIECCFSHPLSECPEVCTKLNEYISENTFQQDLEAWSKICDNLYIWDYTTDYSNYMMIYPNFDVLRENVLFFIENNVKGVFEEGNYSGNSGEFGELRAYLLTKVLWNPYMTEEEYYAYMDDFLEGYYGEGWKYIREFIDLSNEVTEDVHFGTFASVLSIIPFEYTVNEDGTHSWDKSFIEKSDSLFDSAEALAKDDEELARIQKSRLQLEYYKSFYYEKEYPEALRNVTVLYHTRDTVDIRKAEALKVDEYYRNLGTENNKKLYSDMIRFGVTRIKENTRQLKAESDIDFFNTTPYDWGAN